MLNQTNKFVFLMLLFVYPVCIAISDTENKCDQNSIYIRGSSLNSALESLYKIKRFEVYYNRDIYFKFNLINNKLENSDKIDYLSNSPIASPDCQWVYTTKYLSKNNINDYIVCSILSNYKLVIFVSFFAKSIVFRPVSRNCGHQYCS